MYSARSARRPAGAGCRGGERAVGRPRPLHVLALEHVRCCATSESAFHRALAVLVGDHQARLPLVSLPKLTVPCVGQDRRLLGLARLEQVGHPRQTAGDVPGLGDSCGIRRRRRRRCTSSPSSRLTMALPAANSGPASRSRQLTGLPLPSTSFTPGCRSLPAPELLRIDDHRCW